MSEKEPTREECYEQLTKGLMIEPRKKPNDAKPEEKKPLTDKRK